MLPKACHDIEYYLFAFVRQDIPLEDQAIQLGHAVRGITYLYRDGCAIPNLVYIGVPDVKGLEKALGKCQVNAIPHYRWEEPDNDWGFTAFATAPLNIEQKQVFKNYRCWKANNTKIPESSNGQDAAPKGAKSRFES